MEQQDIEHAAALLRLLGESGRLRVRVRVDADGSHGIAGTRVRVETQLLVDDVVVACDSETCEL